MRAGGGYVPSEGAFVASILAIGVGGILAAVEVIRLVIWLIMHVRIV